MGVSSGRPHSQGKPRRLESLFRPPKPNQVQPKIEAEANLSVKATVSSKVKAKAKVQAKAEAKVKGRARVKAMVKEEAKVKAPSCKCPLF